MKEEIFVDLFNSFLEGDITSEAHVMEFLCDFAGILNQDAGFHVSSEAGRSKFRTLAQQLLTMTDASSDSVAGDLNDLVNLMVLQDIYLTGNPRFHAAQEQYWAPHLEAHRQAVDVLNSKNRQLEDAVAILKRDKNTLEQRLKKSQEEARDRKREGKTIAADNVSLTSRLEAVTDALSKVLDEKTKLEQKLEQQKAAGNTANIDSGAYLFWDDQYIHGCAALLSTHDWDGLTSWDKAQIRQLYIEPATPFELYRKGSKNLKSKSVTMSLYGINGFVNLETIIISSKSPCELKLQGSFRNCPRISRIMIDHQDCDLTQVPLDQLRGICIFARPGGNIETYATAHGLQFYPINS